MKPRFENNRHGLIQAKMYLKAINKSYSKSDDVIFEANKHYFEKNNCEKCVNYDKCGEN